MMLDFERDIEALRRHGDYVNVAELADLEMQLQQARKEAGLGKKRSRLFSYIDRKIAEHRMRPVVKKKYMTLLLSCGWLCGSHRFYSGKRISGMLYLLFFWTGIPFAMCVIDLMQVLPMAADEKGEIML